MRTVHITKYAFRIKTRLGLVVDNLLIHGDDVAQAQRKLRQIHPRCEILDCVCLRGGVRVPVDALMPGSAATMR